MEAAQPQKGLKGILLSALGLQHDAPAGPTAQASVLAADVEAADHPTDRDQVPSQQESDSGADVASHSTATDDSDGVFAARLASISQQFSSDAAAARDAQQLLQAAHLQAQRKEAEVLAAADAAYTPAWRRTGLPSKASQLQLDALALSSSRLLNPGAIIAKQQAHQQKEVLQPPAVFAYCDKTAAPHYLQTTGNQKVREGITAARNTAARSPKHKQQQQPSPAGSQLRPPAAQQQQDEAPQHPAHPATSSSTRSQQVRTGLDTSHQQQEGSGALNQSATARRHPWSQLPADEAAVKMAAAAKRYKAMAAIMTPEQRQIEEKIIKSMYQRLSYLRNPRFAAQAAAPAALPLKGSSAAHRHHCGPQASSSTTTVQPRQYGSRAVLSGAEAGFGVCPAQGVLFDAYEPGGVYLQTVQLQNTGTVMRQLRLLPPTSRYFQVSFPRFPLESSALAPGMCAEVDVCFTPDSLGDYEDAFAVETPAGRFEVQLTGRRPHPDLTLPPVLEVGSVLVGNSRCRTFEFVNNGGDGCFLLLTAEQWAATLQQHTHQQRQDSTTSTAAAPGSAAAAAHAADGIWDPNAAAPSVRSGPFSVGPAYLDLPAGATGVLTVEYSPQQEGPQAAEYVLVCDNCTAHPLRVEGSGEQVQVELVGLDGRPWLPQDAQMQLWFGQVCPGAHNTRQLRVSNPTELPFPFRWSVNSAQPGAFTVTPAAGVLQPGTEQTFVLGFAPLSPAPHSATLTLSVQRSGDAGLLSITQWGQQDTQIIDLSATATGMGSLGSTLRPSALDSAAASADGSSSLRGCADPVLLQDGSEGWARGPGDMVQQQQQQQQQQQPGASRWQSVAVLAAEGFGSPVHLTVQPTASLRVPGALTVGDQASLPLRLCNDTDAPAHYTIAPVNSSPAGKDVAPVADVYIAPSQGVVPANSVLDLSVHFTALAAGTDRQTFTVQVLHGQEQQLCTCLDVRQVRVVPSVPALDFGVLCVGASATRMLLLTNLAASSSGHWCMRQHGTQESVPPTLLSFEPCQGELGPLAICTAAVTVTGSCEGPQRLLVRVSSSSVPCSTCARHATGDGARAVAAAEDGSGVSAAGQVCSCSVEYVQVLVLVSSPKVALSKYRLPIKHAYTGVPQHHSLTMTNTSSLPLSFSWVVQPLQPQQCLQLQDLLKKLDQPPARVTYQTQAASQGSRPDRQSGSSSSMGASHSSTSSMSSGQHAEGAAGQVRLEISPICGHLQPGGSVKLQLQLEPLAVGPVALLCCCQVPAMSRLVGFVVTADVGGLQVQYSVVPPDRLPWLLQQQQQAGRRTSSPTTGRRASSPAGRRGSSPSGRSRSAARSRVGSAAIAASSSAVQRSGSPPRQLVQFDSSGSAPVASPGFADSTHAGVLTEHGAAAPVCSQVLAADFGVVSLHQPAELLLQVTNLTSIPSTVRAWMGFFAAAGSGTGLFASSGSWHGGGAAACPAATVEAAAVSGAEANHRWELPVTATGQQSIEAKARGSSPSLRSPSVRSASQGGWSAHHTAHSPGAQQLSAASIAGQLSRTDPCSYSGSRVVSSATIPAEAVVSTVASINHSSTQHRQDKLGDTMAASTGSTSTSNTSGAGVTSSLTLKGPFRAFAGNAMMAARQAAAAAAAALGSGSAGCAVLLLPETCELPGWGSCVVRLQAFNNLPGTYVDTMFVQVGDLQPQQIPVTLQVVGTPLVLSKHRVQRPASEVLHSLMHHQHQPVPALLQTADPAASSSGTQYAANPTTGTGSSGGSGDSASSGTSSSGTSSSGTSSSGGSSQEGREACKLDFGIIPAGLEVQRTVFVSNTGPLPMQLDWSRPPAPDHTSTGASDSSSPTTADPSTALGAACAAPLDGGETSPGAGAGLTAADSASGSRPDTAATAGEAPSHRPSTSTSTGGVRSNISSAAKASAAPPGKKGPGAASAAGPGSTAGAKPPAGKAGAMGSAGQATGATKQPGTRRESVSASTDAAAAAGAQPQQAQVRGQDGTPGGDAAAHSAADSAPGDAEAAAAGATGTSDVAGSAAGASSSEDHGGVGAEPDSALTVVSCEDLLPAGGPSSLLQTLTALQTSTKASTGGTAASVAVSCGGPVCAEGPRGHAVAPAQDAGVGYATAGSLFRVTPEACVIPAGGQQQFVVTFSSSEARVARQVVLRARQQFCTTAASSNGLLSGGQQQVLGGRDAEGSAELKLHILPGARPEYIASGSGSSGEQQKDVKPVRCCIAGGFHPHAAPPPRALPGPTLALSAVAVAPQLSPCDPDCFIWCCSSTHSPSTHTSYLQTASLINGTGCPLVFRLAVQGAFQLVAVVPSVKQDVDAFRGMLGSNSLPPKQRPGDKSATAVTADRLLLLPPGESVGVTIRFDPSVSTAQCGDPASAAAAAVPALSAGAVEGEGAAVGSTTSRSGISSRSTANPSQVQLQGARSNSIARRAPPGASHTAVAAPAAAAAELGHEAGAQGVDEVGAEACGTTETYQGALVVSFTTGQQQTFTLQGVVLRPALIVTAPPCKRLDFGSVHAAAPHMLELVFTNPTEADAAWKTTITQALPSVPTISPTQASARPGRDVKKAAATDAAAVPQQGASAFTVVPEQGVLQGRGLGMPRQQRLQVTFAPCHSGECCGELWLTVAGGGRMCVPLRGLGVHAEGAELRTAYDL